jgi:hypothetical protein
MSGGQVSIQVGRSIVAAALNFPADKRAKSIATTKENRIMLTLKNIRLSFRVEAAY